MPAVQRARRRLRRRRPRDPCGPRRRRVDRERLEDLDVEAHKASWGLLLARTDPDAPKHKGLTAFIVDMHEPGVEVRGIRSMAGASGLQRGVLHRRRGARLDARRRGGRGLARRQRHADERAGLDRQRGRAAGLRPDRRRGAGVEASATDPTPARSVTALMQLWVDAEVLRLGSLRAQAKREKGVPGPEGSILKLLQGRVLTDVAELVVDLMGPAGTLLASRTRHYVARASRRRARGREPRPGAVALRRARRRPSPAAPRRSR